MRSPPFRRLKLIIADNTGYPGAGLAATSWLGAFAGDDVGRVSRSPLSVRLFLFAQRLMFMARPPLPPFDRDAAAKKVRLAEDGWNSRNPSAVSMAYAEDSIWRNRSEFLCGRKAIVAFLTEKWERELEYRLIKELWAFTDNRIAVRFAYEWQDGSGKWWRSYGNENWEFDSDGLMRHRLASINDLEIHEQDRLFRWPQGRRPDDYPGLSDLGL